MYAIGHTYLISILATTAWLGPQSVWHKLYLLHYKLTIILVPLMLSYLLVHLPPFLWKSLLSSVWLASSLEPASCFTSWTSFTSPCLSQPIFLFSTFSIHHSFTLNSNHTFLIKPFHYRSFTIDTPDWLPRLMGPFSVSTLLISFSSWFWCGRLNFSSLSVHTKIDILSSFPHISGNLDTSRGYLFYATCLFTVDIVFVIAM